MERLVIRNLFATKKRNGKYVVVTQIARIADTIEEVESIIRFENMKIKNIDNSDTIFAE